MEVVAIWLLILCAIIASIVAKHKNRNMVGWFLAGLLFGPFGLVVALIFPKIEYVFVTRFYTNVISK
jgi:hypothetical protein